MYLICFQVAIFVHLLSHVCSKDFGKGSLATKTVLVMFGDITRVTACHYIRRKQETTTHNLEVKHPYIARIHTTYCLHYAIIGLSRVLQGEVGEFGFHRGGICNCLYFAASTHSVVYLSQP